jgi:hypothetical protein
MRTFSSASVKPRPRRVRRLYLMVLQIEIRDRALQHSLLRVTLTGIGQSGGACRPGGAQRQQPSHGGPDGG